jgi:hypothetical protein
VWRRKQRSNHHLPSGSGTLHEESLVKPERARKKKTRTRPSVFRQAPDPMHTKRSSYSSQSSQVMMQQPRQKNNRGALPLRCAADLERQTGPPACLPNGGRAPISRLREPGATLERLSRLKAQRPRNRGKPGGKSKSLVNSYS